MRAKNEKMEWYFDILNPILAEICRKYCIKAFVTGNLIRSKGTTGSIYEQENASLNLAHATIWSFLMVEALLVGLLKWQKMRN